MTARINKPENPSVPDLETSPVLLRNRFGLSEFSGAFGDLGTLLPLAFALVVFNGFPPSRLFFLWGLVYLVTGWLYKAPVPVQPLKAMAVIAFGAGMAPSLLSSAAVFYGLLLVILTATGLLQRIQKLFSMAIIRGIQLGIGLILADKAILLSVKKGFLLHTTSLNPLSNFLIMGSVALVISLFLGKRRIPIGLPLIIVGGALGWMGAGGTIPGNPGFSPLSPMLPDAASLWSILVLLIIPQLPLTLGNAVFSAEDTAKTLWGNQAKRVTVNHLALSIGLSDTVIGLLGGFPVCHGAGGMGAHYQFGARTGGATIIMGAVLVIFGGVPLLSGFLFLIPVPILGAMLLVDAIRMGLFARSLSGWVDITTALTVGLLSFFTRNIAIGLASGIAVQWTASRASNWMPKVQARS